MVTNRVALSEIDLHCGRRGWTGTAVAFEPSGQRLIVAHFHTVCIIDRLSGVKLHETPVMGPVREVLALSWINESNH